MVVVTATDAGGNADDVTVVVSITDVDDEAPAFTSLASVSVQENSQINHVVTTSDVDSSDATYIVFGGADSSLFAIDVNTGALTYVSSTGQDFESMTCSQNPCEVIVRASDESGNNNDQTIQITVTDVNEFAVSPPVDSDSDTNEISENAANDASAEITASASDADGSTNAVTYACLLYTSPSPRDS